MTFTWERIMGDRVISPNPAKVGCVIVTPVSASKRGDITLYDGESTGDPRIIKIMTGSGETHITPFTPYLETQRGLYIDVGGDVGEVLIQLCWEKE